MATTGRKSPKRSLSLRGNKNARGNTGGGNGTTQQQTLSAPRMRELGKYHMENETLIERMRTSQANLRTAIEEIARDFGYKTPWKTARGVSAKKGVSAKRGKTQVRPTGGRGSDRITAAG